MNAHIIKELLYKIADDQLILGHRNSEWTGFGPLLEEDIAFSSMAQDKIGQSLAIYQILQQLGELPPDMLAFMRQESAFHNCIFTELPNGEYDFSLVRHFLFDHADFIRFDMLRTSSFQPVAEIAAKIHGELRYHRLHADTWIKQLGSATNDSISRLQLSLSEALPYALGIFEESPEEPELIASGVFGGERALKERWINEIEAVIRETELQLPSWSSIDAAMGGRTGKHSIHLKPLLDEMSEVFRVDPTAEW